MGDENAGGDRPPRSLAGSPHPLAPNDTAPAATAPTAGQPGSTPRPGSSESPRRGSTTTSARPGSTPSSVAPTTAQPAIRYTRIGSVRDPAGDPEGAGPAYADLREVEVADGGGNARLTLVMAGPLPSRVTDNETFGAGVDFFRSLTQNESDYQVFVDGSPDGWFAYLHDGERYLRYPGSFALGGNRLVFTLPWSALGNRRNGRFSAFADWTRQAPGDNPFSEDHAPALATVAYG